MAASEAHPAAHKESLGGRVVRHGEQYRAESQRGSVLILGPSRELRAEEKIVLHRTTQTKVAGSSPFVVRALSAGLHLRGPTAQVESKEEAMVILRIFARKG